MLKPLVAPLLLAACTGGGLEPDASAASDAQTTDTSIRDAPMWDGSVDGSACPAGSELREVLGAGITENLVHVSGELGGRLFVGTFDAAGTRTGHIYDATTLPFPIVCDADPMHGFSSMVGHGGGLYVGTHGNLCPGCPASLGNVFALPDGGRCVRATTTPIGEHVTDLASTGEVLYAVTASSAGAELWRMGPSCCPGTWLEEAGPWNAPGFTHLYSVAVAPRHLYVGDGTGHLYRRPLADDGLLAGSGWERAWCSRPDCADHAQRVFRIQYDAAYDAVMWTSGSRVYRASASGELNAELILATVGSIDDIAGPFDAREYATTVSRCGSRARDPVGRICVGGRDARGVATAWESCGPTGTEGFVVTGSDLDGPGSMALGSRDRLERGRVIGTHPGGRLYLGD